MNVYAKERDTMKAEEFVSFLENKLQEVNGIDAETSKRQAATMIAGKKRIEDGEYAILQKISQDEEEVNIEYYKRVDDVWVFDKEATASQENYALPMSKQLCDTAKCISDTNISKTIQSNLKDYNMKTPEFDNKINDQPLVTTHTCNPSNIHKNEIKSKLLREMMEEYKHQIAKSENTYRHELESNIKRYKRLGQLQQIKKAQYDNFALLLGNRATMLVSVKSPYEGILQNVLQIQDHYNKHQEMLMFIHKYARVSIYPEDKYWFYCKQTNTKLLPTFYQLIAKAVVQSNKSFDNTQYVQKAMMEAILWTNIAVML
jgi:hypothetical protein